MDWREAKLSRQRIARHLVELHHGTIKVASEGEGQGVTFTVRLPLMNAAELLEFKQEGRRKDV